MRVSGSYAVGIIKDVFNNCDVLIILSVLIHMFQDPIVMRTAGKAGKIGMDLPFIITDDHDRQQLLELPGTVVSGIVAQWSNAKRPYGAIHESLQYHS